MIQLTPIHPPRTTVSSLLHIEPLGASFDHLKRTVSTLAELTAWFKAHPGVLLDGVSINDDAVIDVTATHNSIDLYASTPDCGLDVTLSIEVVTPLKKNTHIKESLQLRSDGVQLKNTVRLTLSMQDWPIGCAAVAAKYVIVVSDCIKPAFVAVESLLHTYIPRHFPGFTLEKLQAIVDADFLPLDEQKRPYISDVVDLLFGTYAISTALELPGDVA